MLQSFMELMAAKAGGVSSGRSLSGRRAPGLRSLAVHSLLLLATLYTAPLAFAADTNPAPPDSPQVKDPLAGKQQIVRDRMTQLEDRMFRLSEKLAKTEPEQAQRLQASLRQARELLIRRNMEETAALLEQGKLTEAADREAAVSRNLDKILQLLLEEGDGQQRKQDLDRLRAYERQVQQLLMEQQRLKEHGDALTRLQGLKAAIEAAAAHLDKLIGRQQGQLQQTAAAAKPGRTGSTAPLADAQRQIRSDSESLAKELDRTAATRPAATEPASDSRPAADAQRASASQPYAAASQPEASATQPAELTEESLQAALRGAGREVQRAGEHMQAGEGQLREGSPNKSIPSQKAALGALQRARVELKQQESNARRLLELAGRQRELKEQTDRLAQQMGKPAGGDNKGGSSTESQPGQQGEPSEGGKPGNQRDAGGSEQTPGQQNVQRAGQHMQDAAEELDKSADASKHQQKAMEQLEQARRELEQALDQLRREQQEEVLRGLESRFRGMLAQQLTINKTTDDLQTRAAAWVHADELLLAGLSRDENKLADEAATASHILKEDGTSIVFPRIVDQMRGDMLEVGKRLGARQTAPPTQPIEAEIVRTLGELVDAIKQMRKELQASGGSSGGGGQPGNAPLLPASAELKLLRSCQERVNRDTARFPEPPPPSDTERLTEMKHIAERQREVADMARKMNERATGQ
jgi:hypothetical protein